MYKPLKHSHWLASLYGFCSVALVPWVFVLANTLSRRRSGPDWHVAWIGLDVLLIATMAVSAVLLLRDSLWLSVTASMAGTILVLDAWFDILTSRGVQFDRAIVSAVFLEIPLALLSFWIAVRRVLERSSPNGRLVRPKQPKRRR